MIKFQERILSIHPDLITDKREREEHLVIWIIHVSLSVRKAEERALVYEPISETKTFVDDGETSST